MMADRSVRMGVQHSATDPSWKLNPSWTFDRGQRGRTPTDEITPGLRPHSPTLLESNRGLQRRTADAEGAKTSNGIARQPCAASLIRALVQDHLRFSGKEHVSTQVATKLSSRGKTTGTGSLTTIKEEPCPQRGMHTLAKPIVASEATRFVRCPSISGPHSAVPSDLPSRRNQDANLTTSMHPDVEVSPRASIRLQRDEVTSISPKAAKLLQRARSVDQTVPRTPRGLRHSSSSRRSLSADGSRSGSSKTYPSRRRYEVTPGPGDHDTAHSKAKHTYHSSFGLAKGHDVYPLRRSSSYDGTSSSGLAEQHRAAAALHRATPGPCDYTTIFVRKSSFRASFGSGPGHSTPRDLSPGPCEYSTCSPRKHSYSASFGKAAGHHSPIALSPGPGDYNAKFERKHAYHSSFGTICGHELFVKRDRSPGPADYNLRGRGARHVYRAFFGDSPGHETCFVKARYSSPGPGHYSVTELTPKHAYRPIFGSSPGHDYDIIFRKAQLNTWSQLRTACKY